VESLSLTMLAQALAKTMGDRATILIKDLQRIRAGERLISRSKTGRIDRGWPDWPTAAGRIVVL
jgi:hypothetical protein